MPSTTTPPLQVPLTRPVFNDGTLANSFNVNIQAIGSNGQTSAFHPCLVDTGSCGIVVPESLFYVNGDMNNTLIEGVQRGAPAIVTYEPSSDDLHGFYYTIPQLTIGGSSGNAPAFTCTNVTVVGVSDATNPNMGMMGVGFGRPKSYGDNVLLCAPVYPSYLFTQDSIWLGYTRANLPSASSYGFQQLQRQLPSLGVPLPGWQTPVANITITPTGSTNATSFPATALLDTGINSMMLGAAYGALWPSDLIGTTVAISWQGDTEGSSILSYEFNITGIAEPTVDNAGKPPFAVSGSSPMKPTEVSALGPNSPAFVNTGIHVLLGANYFYDSQLGQIGLMSTIGR